MEALADPQYAMQLKERILALEEKIKKGHRMKKSLEVAQLHREKLINQVIEVGESAVLMDIRKAKTDLAVYHNKLGEAEGAFNRNEDVIEEFRKKQVRLEAELKELKSNAKDMGINLSKPKKRTNGNLKKYKKLEQRMEGLSKELNLVRTRYNLTVSEFASEKNKLHKRMARVNEEIQKKNEYFSLIYNSLWLSYIDELTSLTEHLRGPYMDIIEATLKRWENMRAQFVAHEARSGSAQEVSQRAYTPFLK
eukprot:TRINITY_DN2618_c0_g2_i14.p2 TRINITY_DN2618_c0_g2~~TRINITY_DN2618_c0_g2_i14.p2  ORF type:complete len:251 (+),score=69.55 TRINITY_DN2618_c0_g2_i14:352-1104(+)